MSVLFIVSTGRNRTLRHFERTHRVSVAWLNEIYTRHKNISWYYAATAEMVADLFTKHFSSASTFQRLRTLVGISQSVGDMITASRELLSLRSGQNRIAFDPCEYDRPRALLKYCGSAETQGAE